MFANMHLHLALPLLAHSSTTKLPLCGAFYTIRWFSMLLYGDSHVTTMVPYQNNRHRATQLLG